MIQQTPDRRPNTSDLIQYPYARRLIAEFKAHVSNPALFRSDDPNERERILRDINSAIPPEAMAAPIVAKPAIRYARATILNTDGDWKTRFVALNGAGISIGLTLEMNADQSKSYPLPRIATVTARGTYILAIYFKSHGGQILTQFDSTEERNEWVEVLNLALRGQAPPQPT